MNRSRRGLADAHLKIPKHFLLDGCMYVSSQILSLGYLFSGDGFFNLNSKIATEKVVPHILSVHISPCSATGFMSFLVSSPLKLSQVGVPRGSVYKRYI